MRNRKTSFLGNHKRRRLGNLRRSMVRRRRAVILDYLDIKTESLPHVNAFLVRGGKLLQNRYRRRRHLLSRNLHE